jgi:gluconolactonase
MIPVLRDAGLSKLLDGDSVETVADGLVFTEGPLWLPDGSLLFQDMKADKTYKVAPDGTLSVLRSDTHAANGQTFDAEGRIVFCEQNGRRVSRMNPDGSNVETVVESWQGARLNSPNDIVARRDGLIYFTDPPYGVAPADRSLHFQGVYALDSLAVPRLILDDLEKPNGLAFSPDESTLYVCDTARYHVRAFKIELSGAVVVGSGRVFCTLDPGQPGGPDGMKVDTEGRVYVAVALGVWVLEPDGALLGILSLPQRPSNLAWGDLDGKTLFITAVDHVYKVRFKVAGVTPPHLPRASLA